MNLAFNVFLLWPAVRTPRRLAAVAAGLAAPLAATWWRNRGIIADHAWLFSWDGLAARGEDFGLLSTLLPQMHPAVAEGLARYQPVCYPSELG